MSKVICPCIECVHNNGTVCNANEIELTFNNIATVNEGKVNMWVCKQYELSDFAKKIEKEIANTIGLQTEFDLKLSCKYFDIQTKECSKNLDTSDCENCIKFRTF